jgi:hypothetical protein
VPAASRSSSESSVSMLDKLRNARGVTPASLVALKPRSKPARKKLVRRIDREYSQPLRLGAQLFLVLLNTWIGIQFYLWVRWAESGGRALEVSRPAGVEGWLPIEGLMQLKYFLITGDIPHVHAAGFFLFSSFLLISLAFRKAFCSWCVRWERFLNTCGNWVAQLSGEISNYHIGPISHYGR